ncbi:MAG TPA: RNA polymerase sigma factor [Opitutaceae bacterium]|nr:RNA polymerase sigma factor [Opitutaceae bacterium]
MNSEPPHDPHESEASAHDPVGAGGPPDPDHEEARRARAGDRRAMEALTLRHQPSVTRLLWRFARSPSDLDDLVQETFLRMVRGLPGWQARQPFAHWLLRIATNVGRDYFRRQAVRRRWTAEPTSDEIDLAPAVDPGGDPAARAAANEVKTMLAGLTPDDRTLLTLYHLEGWDLATIARHCGWTVTATKVRAWRARRQLRALLEDHS